MSLQPRPREETLSTPADASPAPRRPVIAIDGPAGAGKSTLAAYLARCFGFLNIETGAMYRALALKAIEQDLSFDQEGPLLALTQSTRIVLDPRPDGNRVLLDGLDVSERIREADVTAAASRVSVHPRLRAWMVQQQQALAAHGGVVMEGRDIGTAVFPDADVKIFLDATPEVRGNRRYRQVVPIQPPTQSSIQPQAQSNSQPSSHSAKPLPGSRQAIVQEMQERDHRDRSRAESPLRPAADAIVLDSTSLSLEEVLARAEKIVRSRLPSA